MKASDAASFLMVLGCAVAGLAGGGAWLTLPASLLLMLCGSLRETLALRARALVEVRQGGAWWLRIAGHWAYAFIACLAAFGMGWLLRVLTA